MDPQFWLKSYPASVPAEADVNRYRNLTQIIDEAVREFGPKPAYINLDHTLTYNDVDRLSKDFAAFLQNQTSLNPGDKIAIQMPNVLQYPIVLYGALRAGLVVVNTNPLYTAREMVHQFNDSGSTALVILANFAHLLEEVLPKTQIKTVIITEIGDVLPGLKRPIVNFVVKHVKNMVPKYRVDNALKFTHVMKAGAKLKFKPVDVGPDDLAFLQYTGGTTGVSKGAMLTHGNVCANIQQAHACMGPQMDAVKGQPTAVTPLPLYHIFALVVNSFLVAKMGAKNVLITNPRDLPAFIKDMSKHQVNLITGVNTLFNALLNNEEFRKLDHSQLKLTVGGAMAIQQAVAEKWKEVTGCELLEGYGLTEASPLVSVNPMDGTGRIGTIGLPAPNTLVKLIDDEGNEITELDTPGELCAFGPQIMKGYYNRPEETAKVITPDGWLLTGDMAVWKTDGFLKIVDRKKEMILVSGFNVYPNEVEDAIASHPGVLEVAAIGIPDEHSGEVVKVYVVKKDPSLTEADVKKHAETQLTNYKRPKQVEFRSELPKSNVGKILRRVLREEALAKLK
jgi:long-chain acyl-CoA synthetase